MSESRDQSTVAVPASPAATGAPASTPPLLGDDVVLVRAGPEGDPVLEELLRDTGFPVRAVTLGPGTARALAAAPPLLLVLELEPWDARLLPLVRELEGALSQLAPAALAVMRIDDEERLDATLAAGVRDVVSVPVAPPLLRLKVDKNVRRRLGVTAIGAYRVARVLGRGGMGVVYEAEKDDRRYALKVLEVSPHLPPETLARFRRETESLRALEGPGIPRFFEAGRTADCFFYVMEHVAGETLQELARSGPVEEPKLRRVGADVAAALAAIHGAGFVHRDIKPSNVIVTPSGGAKLIDYGLAKLVDDLALTRSDEVFGTLVYMAPELLQGGEASPLTDAWALGMTIFHAALGASPLDGSASYVMNRILSGTIPRAAQRLEGVSPELVALVDGLLETDPARRLSVADARRVLGGAASVAERGLELVLRFQSGEREGEALSFRERARIVAGRSKECEVVLLDPNVSRRHCSIALEDGRAQVKDLASANGTFVNGVRVGLAVLSDGDRLRLADTELRVELAQTAAAPPREAPREDEGGAPAPPLAIPGYELLRPIGAGASSSVFEARATRTGEAFAIKVLRGPFALVPETRQRFLREARTASTLLHPNIVRVLDRGQTGDAFYLVMELVAGETLRARIDQKGPLPVPLALRIAHQIAQALELARTCGIVHRDVKPENVLVQEDGTAKLADFGLAKWVLGSGESGLTHQGEVLGTLAYMSPEQLTSSVNAGHRADIYSLGATLHHALAGAPPFAGKTAVECFRKVLEEPPPALRALRPDVPPVVATLVARCLAKRPEGRPASAGEVVRLLDALLASAADRATVF